MNITNELRDLVKTLEQRIHTKSNEATKARGECKRVQQEANRLWDTMNFRERNLDGWFGGDRSKVANHRKFQAQAHKLDSKAERLQREVKKLNAKVMRILEDFLREHDGDYQELVRPYDAALKMKKAVDTFLGMIDDALSEIDDAQGMETADLCTNNIGISVLSCMENSEANEALEKVRQAVKPFQNAVNTYNGFLTGYEVPQHQGEINDGIDLGFDLVFDGFDFMSIFTLSALNHAEGNLQEARKKIVEVDKIVSGHLEQIAKVVFAYTQNTRAACT